ncbi:MAG TPA: FlgD immunoglobulin-like domain containing protein [Thermoanaerobaculia bacterium]
MTERTRFSRSRWGLALAIAMLAATAGRGGSRAIVEVSTAQTSMNPTIGESVPLTVRLARDGAVTVRVVDRDGYPVRTLAGAAAAKAGENRWTWDGRDAAGRIVPDEAYSFRVDWSSGAERETWFPADTPAHPVSVDAEYYASRSGAIVYTLPVPSRVHLQAGTARKNPKTGEMEGPVLKTVVNREPRDRGRIAEPWSGLDESGQVRIADMRDFVLAIAATPLPANSVVTFGNRERAFAEAALTRTGTSLLTPRPKGSHHAGLTVLEDLSPAMSIEALNGSWSAEERAWTVQGRTLRLRVSLSGPSASTFAAQKGELHRFVDGRLVSTTRRPSSFPSIVEVPLPPAEGVRNVSLNWESEFGAVAANTIRVRGAGR